MYYLKHSCYDLFADKWVASINYNILNCPLYCKDEAFYHAKPRKKEKNDRGKSNKGECFQECHVQHQQMMENLLIDDSVE